MITISNDVLSVKVVEKGAELQSIQSNGLEYLWQADPVYWAKHSPVLFPVVGELKDGKYIFENKEYKMPRHGFARDKVFEADQASETCVTFTLNSDEESFLIYPFKFIFKIEYELKERELMCSYIVENPGDKTLYFSVGAHPAFNVPLQQNLQYTNYELKFDNDHKLSRHLLHNGLTGDHTKTIELDKGVLHLTPSLFYDDAIVLKFIGSRQIKLMTEKDKHGLKFTFDEFPYFGIWAAKDAPFICLEPWCGIADNIHHNYQLTDKEGINLLQPGESWRRKWCVQVF